MRPSPSLALLLVSGLCACSGMRAPAPAETPTLKSLASRQVVVPVDSGIAADEGKAIAAYGRFLDAAPRASQRSEAMRRLGDLEMDHADTRFATTDSSNTSTDYRAAVQRYQNYLKTYPGEASNDRVLYQLARAYEQGGEMETALQTLDQLVQQFPQTAYRDEAHFRRGEMLFAMRDYVKSEQAFAMVLKGDQGNVYQDRSLYMQGWSMFKQGRLEDALHPFFAVLDLKMGSQEGEADGDLDTLPGLTRADRELVEDTFRVTSLCLQNLQGAESIPKYINSDERRSYEFRVYQQLGELYIRQDRIKDAADTFGIFARLHPLHAQAPLLQTRVIDIYEQAGFGNLALEAKKEYVVRYGAHSEFRSANPQGWEHAQPLVKTHLAELARYHHAAAQKSRKSADYQEAVRWYRSYLESFPADPQAAQNNFLLAELLFEDGRFKDSAAEYEKAAYQYPAHARSADAGYSALLSYAKQEARATPAELPTLQHASTASALRFAQAFPSDPRAGLVLSNAAEQLYALHDTEQAAQLAQQVLALKPAAAAAQRRVAWTVLAHTAFEQGSFDRAERAYGEVLALTPKKDPARAQLIERQAAAIYKQGEAARDAGQLQAAVGHFNRVAAVAPQSTVNATAQYDAAAAWIALKDWDKAAPALEDFRQRYPKHPLQDQVSAKLTVIYAEKGNWAQAAAELERVATTQKDPKLARETLWQSAELYDKAAEHGGSHAPASRVYALYLKQYPQPLEPAVEARYRLARLAKSDGNPGRELALMKDIFQADQAGGAARTPRTRYLGATAALALAEPAAESCRQVALVEPLAKQLKVKKARLEDALKAYAVAADYGVADVTTAATYQTATLYQDFGKALMASQRPKKLSKTELEQYNVLLEEQAYPFEEKSTELHEVNARRASQGIYDAWVKRSFNALRELRPVRYGKSERSEGVIDAIR